MEGVVILSNNKPLISSYFERPRIASLAVDAFLAQKRSRPNPPIRSGVNSNSSSNKSSVDPVIWLEAIDDIQGPLAGSSNGKISRKQQRKAISRRDSYTVTSDEDEDSSDNSSEEDDEVDVEAEWNDAAGPSSSSSSAISAGNAYACCHITHNSLHFLVPVRRECDPAVAFSYLYSLIGVLRTYLNEEISDISLRDNFDIVLQLLSETFNAPFPISTDASALSELVPSTNFALFNKVLSAGLAAATQASGNIANSGNSTPILPGSSGSTPFSSPLHWRRAGIRYAQNEVYFDITEEVKAILDKNGNVITGDIWGRIDCKSRLSGMPDLSVNFSNANMLQDTSFHPCVRLARWTTSKILSFVPPDGAFELMGYRLDSSSSSQSSSIKRTATSSSSASSANLPIPLRIRPVITVGEIGGSFNITVSPPTSFGAGGATKLEDVVISLKLGENATGIKGSISSPASSASRIQSSSSIRALGDKSPPASWEFDTTSHTLIWRIPKLQSSSPTLSGTWLFDESKKGSTTSRPSPTLDVTFKAPLSNISGLSITNLKVEGERYSMYKALRSHLTGSLEVRW